MDSPHFDIRPYDSSDQSGVIDLWHRCNLIVPWNDPVKDILAKMMVQPDLFLVATQQRKIIGTAMAGYDGHRGWVNYLAVHPDHQRSGIGSTLMKRAAEGLRKLGCQKINVQIRTSNSSAIRFYESIGFRQDEVISMGLRIDI